MTETATLGGCCRAPCLDEPAFPPAADAPAFPPAADAPAFAPPAAEPAFAALAPAEGAFAALAPAAEGALRADDDDDTRNKPALSVSDVPCKDLNRGRDCSFGNNCCCSFRL